MRSADEGTMYAPLRVPNFEQLADHGKKPWIKPVPYFIEERTGPTFTAFLGQLTEFLGTMQYCPSKPYVQRQDVDESIPLCIALTAALASRPPYKQLRERSFVRLLRELSGVIPCDDTAKLLEDCCTIRHPSAVSSFLREHFYLVSLIRDAATRVRDYVDAETIFLEKFSDPESEDYEQLVLSIVPRMAPDAADRALERFEDEWWLDNLSAAKGNLCVTLEFK